MAVEVITRPDHIFVLLGNDENCLFLRFVRMGSGCVDLEESWELLSPRADQFIFGHNLATTATVYYKFGLLSQNVHAKIVQLKHVDY